ncbi:MAG: Ldh family oxidoreductase, partial [Gammaproteobacteria bacterium]|nr:Ldh family oxidoreductase [Gammaproteobacteria bacterium]
QFGYEASSFFEANGPPPGIGQLFLLLRPEVMAGDGFVGRVEELLSYILTQDGTRLPGSQRLQHRLLARRDGVSISRSLHQDLLDRAGV